LAACALLAVVAISAAQAPTGAYRGTTEQNRKVQLRVTAHTVTLIRLKIRLRCLDGSILYDDLSDFAPTRLQTRGRFADVQVGPTDEVLWRGRVRARSVRGKLRVKDKVAGNVSCDSGFVGFAARPAGQRDG